MGSSQSAPSRHDDKKGKVVDDKKAFTREGIKFTKGRPTFTKSEHVGNKGEFPELGGDDKKNTQTKAAQGGPIG